MRKARERWERDHPGIALPDFFVLAVRAYFSRTIAPDGNNVGCYDDAFFVVSPLGFSAWNGNTDPSRYGWNPNADKFMARLAPGCYRFIRRMHRGRYWAYGQGENPVTVERIREDRTVAVTETGCFGIDLHPGSENGTSSEGCNTVPPGQWGAFDSRLHGTMRKLGSGHFAFILIEGPIC